VYTTNIFNPNTFFDKQLKSFHSKGFLHPIHIVQLIWPTWLKICKNWLMRMIPWLIADLCSFSYNPMKYGHFYVIKPNPSSFNKPNDDFFHITHLAKNKNTVWCDLIFQHDQAWNFHVDHAIGHIWTGSCFIIDRQNGWSFSTRLEFNPAT